MSKCAWSGTISCYTCPDEPVCKSWAGDPLETQNKIGGIKNGAAENVCEDDH